MTTKLVVFDGDEVVKEVRLHGTALRIGRDTRNDVVIDDSSKAVSRFHAEIRDQGGGYIVADLGSRNGVWIRGQRVKNTAPVALGIPISIGPFELVLEDDVSTSEFGEVPAPKPPPVADRRPVASRSGTLPGPQAAPKAKSTMRLMPWMAVAAGVVGVAAIALVVVYNVISGSKPIDTTTISTTTSSSSSTTTSVSATELNQQRVNEFLTLARQQIDDKNYDAALVTIGQALEIDKENKDALNLKQTVQGLINPPPPKHHDDKETFVAQPGIPRRPEEKKAAYDQRVERIKGNYDNGKLALFREQYAAALESFDKVESEQPGYVDLASLIAETKRKQQTAVATDISTGQQHEAAKGFKEARDWYEKALVDDPTSAAARERLDSAKTSLFQQASALMSKSTLQRKLGDTAAAKAGFQEVMKLLKPDDDLYKEAQRNMKEIEK